MKIDMISLCCPQAIHARTHESPIETVEWPIVYGDVSEKRFSIVIGLQDCIIYGCSLSPKRQQPLFILSINWWLKNPFGMFFDSEMFQLYLFLGVIFFGIPSFQPS